MLANKKIKLAGILIVVILGVYLGFRFILPLFTPFVIAYFISWILLPIVRFLSEKLKFSKIIASILSLLFVGGILFWGLGYLGNVFVNQIVTLLKNMPIYLAILADKLDKFCNGCDKLFDIELGTARALLDTQFDYVLVVMRTKVLPGITAYSLQLAISIAGAVGVVLIVIVSTLLLLKDSDKYKDSFKKMYLYPEIHLITGKLSETGIAYLKTQAILMLCISGICSLGLMLLGNKYALLIGIGIGIFDAFPILGSGLILVRWSIITLVGGDIYGAAILLTLYFICQIMRQFLEPKLLGNRIGIKPVYTLMAVYVGFKLFGFAGFFLGPLSMVVMVTIIRECMGSFGKDDSSSLDVSH